MQWRGVMLAYWQFSLGWTAWLREDMGCHKKNLASIKTLHPAIIILSTSITPPSPPKY